MNKYTEPGAESRIERLKLDENLRERRTHLLESVRKNRDPRAWEKATAGLRRATEKEENILPAVIDCVKAQVTLGEICSVLKEYHGTYDRES